MFKTVLALLLANPILLAAVDLNREADLRRFVARVAENERKNRFREMGYFYRLKNHRIILDRRGREKKRTSSTYEVIPLDDGVYRKLIRRNGEPLSAKEARETAEKGRSPAAPPEKPLSQGPRQAGTQAGRTAPQGGPFLGGGGSGLSFSLSGRGSAERAAGGRGGSAAPGELPSPRKGFVDSGQAQGPDLDRQRRICS